MAKFHGVIGYVRTEETKPGVYEEKVTEYHYYGDVLRDTRRWEKSEGLNDNLNINNQFSIVGDWFSYENFSTMRYLTYMGTKWKITSVEVHRPRLMVNVGGIYNAP
jgi:hypothetical protein